ATANTKVKVYDRDRMVADFSWFEPPPAPAGQSFAAGGLLAQWRLEEILRARLDSLGVVVEADRALHGLRQDDSGVRARVIDAAGAEHDIDAAYVVGADGPDSTVRRLVQIGVAGSPTPASAPRATSPSGDDSQAYEADVVLQGLDRDDVTHFWYDGQHLTTLVANPGADTWSLQLADADGEAASVTNPGRPNRPTPRGCEAEFHRRTGWTHVRFTDVRWLSTSPAISGVADSFRVDRVFVAGEAAHPSAGMSGPDTGVHDAYNLGWKLAAVLRGAGEDLLDSYEYERQPAARMRHTGRRVLPVPPRLLRTPVMRFRPLTRMALRRQLDRVSHLDLHYRDSRLSQELGGRQVWPRAGERMPDARLWSPAHAAAVRLHEIFAGTHWTLIGLGSLTAEAIRAIELQLGPAVRGEVIGGGLGRVPGVTLVDRFGDARQLLGRRGGSVLVVRPDGYLGLRCGATPNIIAAYLEDMVAPEAFARR
ncbi:MAG TPA: FAD-dependent monooxygenase, partial [Actinopolymorphaceae bacterium]|nr:FAD-dependent monooxygenase [Actinopolymorphaceae bacterium]